MEPDRVQMEPDRDARLSQLLDRQQAGILTEGERPQLQFLMQIYQEGLLRKATALSEAVKRGLMPPLNQFIPGLKDRGSHAKRYRE